MWCSDPQPPTRACYTRMPQGPTHQGYMHVLGVGSPQHACHQTNTLHNHHRCTTCSYMGGCTHTHDGARQTTGDPMREKHATMREKVHENQHEKLYDKVPEHLHEKLHENVHEKAPEQSPEKLHENLHEKVHAQTPEKLHANKHEKVHAQTHEKLHGRCMTTACKRARCGVPSTTNT